MPKARKLPSGSWRCQVYSHTDINGKRKYESFTSDDPSPAGKREAEFAAAEFSLTKKQYSQSTITFGQALDNYIAQRNDILSPSTIRKYKGMRRNNLQCLMNVKLKDFTQDVVQSAINAESVNRSPKSVRNAHGLITAVLRQNRVNLILTTALPKKVRPKLYIPSDKEVKQLMECVKDTDMEIPVLLAAFGAMRRGEISALISEDISGNTIHISRTAVLDENNNWVIKAPKSFAGDRFIELPEFVMKKIANKKGNIIEMTPNKITSKFEHVLKRADLPHFRFHDLRHYNASIAHALGIPDAYIMQMGGWGNDRVLKEVYRHVMEKTRKEMNKKTISHFENMQHEISHE